MFSAYRARIGDARRGLASLGLTLSVMAVAGVWAASPSRADDIGYLVNVTMRPGYGFANADTALAYGHQLCDLIATGHGYPDLAAIIRSDFDTSDEFLVSYLLSQAGQELCPSEIWALRQSAGGYRPPQA